ncbi:MAG: TIR domain-containing protein, partial [Hyphomonas sp.]|nr:TIR domain-containing protein [Hyphomonas sp.]
MSDIFISYAREDLPKARLLAEAMIADGLSVWWDHDLLGGDQFREEISETIAAAKIVIVIWSENSVRSPFVKDEASRANERGVLLPVAIGDVEPPVGFGELQTIRFKRWAETTAEWETLVRTVQARLRAAGSAPVPGALHSSRRELSFINRNIDVFLLIMFAQSIRLDQAILGDHSRSSRISAFARMTSFRMMAVMATLGGLPRAVNSL